MGQTLPEEISKRSFSKVIRGYNPTEVDEYITAATENYSSLYREYAELEHKLALALDRLSKLDGEEEKVRKTLETARGAADKIVSDAYERSDAILASIKHSCDQILRSFRDKTEAQKTALAAMQKNIFGFKNELFEKYRLHIELIEQLSPVFEYEEDLTPEQYVERVVSTMNREISAEYGINLSGFDAAPPEENKTSVPPSDTAVCDTKAEASQNKPEANSRKKPRPPKKKGAGHSVKAAVMKLIDEYETPGAARADLGGGAVQMGFDFDSASETLEETK